MKSAISLRVVAIAFGAAAATVSCVATTPANSAADAGGAATNFGTPGADASAAIDAAKADAVAKVDTAASADGPVDGAAGTQTDVEPNGDAAADANTSAADGDPPADGLIEDSPEPADTSVDTAAKPDIVLADTKADTSKTDVGTDSAGGAPTFAAVYEGVFKKYGCNSAYCHGVLLGNSPVGAHTKVMAWQPSSKACQGKAVVVAGQPAGSLLWTKIALGVATCEGKMPPGDGGGVNDADAKLVHDWIAAGAKP